MRSSTLLDSAVFHLTPTRTRCDLLITANGRTEKIASGLLNPFLAHLKTAQDQIAKGGYSIVLEPERRDDDDVDTSWFTKGSLERFVRFVSTPDILERVHIIESEMLQIEESIVLKGKNDVVINNVEHRQSKPLANHEAYMTMQDDANEGKTIVLYKDDEEHEGNGSGENSKVQLLKVLEIRKTGLQKEQGMAFARAVAAGFDIDQMTPLVSFAECFGATRLMNACLKFMDLWKRKHESGQWLEIETTAEPMCNRSLDFGTMNALEEQNDESAEKRSPMDQKEYINRGQIPQGPQPMFFPSWPIHSPPGTVQGVPYYHSPLYLPPYQMDQMDHHPMDSEIYQKKTRRSSKKKQDVVRNIESEEELSPPSLKKKGVERDRSKVELYRFDNQEDTSYRNEVDNGGHWQAFQNLLLKDADDDNKHTSNQDKNDQSFIVPFRKMTLDNGDDKNAIDMESELPSKHQKLEHSSSRKTCYEQFDLNLKKPEGRGKNETAGYDPTLESNKLQNNRVKGRTIVEGNGVKNLNRTSERKKSVSAGGPIRNVKKPSRTSHLDDARARADKLRSYKADLQKVKKEMEAKELKRLEALKIERQKRIATRGGYSTPTRSSLPSPQSRKRIPSKLPSPSSNPGSKFSDVQPGASSPLQRSKIRNASLISASKTGTNNSNTNRLVKSVSSFPDPNKKDNTLVITSETKASMTRIRRLSVPRTVAPESLSKPKMVSSSSGRPDSKKISAIINLDKSKSATLAELKIRTSLKRTMDGRTKLAAVNGAKPSSAASETKNVVKITAHDNNDDTNVIEKTVLKLECDKKPSLAVQQAYLLDDLKKSEGITFHSEEKQKNFGGKSDMERHNQPTTTTTTATAYAARPENIVDKRVAETTKTIQHIPGLPHNSLKLERIPEILEKSPKGLKRFLNFGKNKYLAGASYHGYEAAATTNANTGRAVSSEVGSSNTLKNLISQSLDEHPDSAFTTPHKSSRHHFSSLFSPFRSSKKSNEKKNRSG